MGKLALLKIILASVPDEVEEEIKDDILDFAEKIAAKTPSSIDDKAVSALRSLLGVEDGDD